MGKRRHRIPNRNATRSQVADLQLVRDDAPSLAAQESLPTLVHHPDPETDQLPEVVAGVAGSMLGALASCRHRLEAELCLAQMFGMLGAGLAEDMSEAERVEAVAVLLNGMIQYCEREPEPSALGFLRLVSQQGPAVCREPAGRAAENLSLRGVADPRWAAQSSLSLVRAWRYGDVFGTQSSVGMLFTYGHREHALAVLIDHELGGGLKDVWFAEGRQARGMRDQVAASMANEPVAIFEDISAHDGLATLRSALACPPCPRAPDQIEDVDAHLYLAHARAQQLAELLGEPPVELYADTLVLEGDAEAGAAEALTLKITLAWTKPPIWRRVEVPATMSLASLHQVIQIAFGWNDSHLHAFEITKDERVQTLDGAVLERTRLSSVLPESGRRLQYVYDFGDNWVHTIVLEKRLPAEDGVVYPRCTAGRRAAPPEDSGGVPGYEYLLEILADPQHPEHEERTEWGALDPARFERAAVNSALATLARTRP